MNATCPNCGGLLPADGFPEVYAELRRYKGELRLDAAFTCADCGAQLSIEGAGDGLLDLVPESHADRFDGGGYSV